MWRGIFLLLLLVGLMLGCNNSDDNRDQQIHMFTLQPADDTGIRFRNDLQSQEDFDVFRYRNFYNGGGVAIGDINNDGLSDVYLTSNMGKNKLYLNKGNFKFEDISAKAGVEGSKVWCTGVAMADVNGDGLLDIYVCDSGDVKGDRRENELFINNGDLTFSEQAEKYGLADKGFSTHAAFFDYDKDGDLDCYILNNSFKPVSTLGYRNLRDERDVQGGDKLFNNDNGHFNDVSEKAGIYGSVIGFGLGVTVGDINQDGWQDLYISNDFYERDYLYINNHDGTFQEKLPEYIGQISMFSMGADLADINNDGYPDIFSTDMLPEDDYRLKTLTAFETYDVYQLRLRNGYYHQFMRNMLQLNNGDGTFSEVAQLSGVDASDWSWGALIADLDNDSKKEIFVSNGIYKDVIDQDFIEYMGDSKTFHQAVDGKKVDFNEFIKKMKSHELSNFLYVQDSDYHFTNQSTAWGLSTPGFSNGAAYGDLDNDGDLDLIVNNVNQEAFVYRNNAREITNNHYLTLSFKGAGGNTFGLGASVKVFNSHGIIYNEHNPIRGFQSSMDYKMVIGLGQIASIDSMLITWPDGKSQMLKNVKVDSTITVDQRDADRASDEKRMPTPLLTESQKAVDIRHTENEFNEFDADRLQYFMMSTQGPAYAKADLNHDNLDDFFLGGAIGYPGAIYLQQPSGNFKKVVVPAFVKDSLSEDVDAVFFDADGDSDLDLYVVSGGSEYSLRSPYVLDRLYENKGLKDGIPYFEKTQNKLPAFYQIGSCVAVNDFDHDGDPDLFVGTRLMPAYYGKPCDQYLLQNDGTGKFEDVTESVAPELKKMGMVTDAMWFDYDGDTFQDLMLVGEWMPVTVLKNSEGRIFKSVSIPGLQETNGWWNTITASDLDGDGDVDFVLGNLGLNSKFRPSRQFPLKLYVNDFDENGSVEPIFTYTRNGKEYPMAMRQDIIKQMSSLKKKFVYYRDYAGKTVNEIFDKKLLDNSTVQLFYEPHTSLLINTGDGDFVLKPLPVRAQFSPVYGIFPVDLDHDHDVDLVLGGNFFDLKPEVGRFDALQGLVLLNDGNANFRALQSVESGLLLNGAVRHVDMIKNANGTNEIIFVRNNDTVKFYKIK